MNRARSLGLALPVLLVVGLALLPFVHRTIGPLLPGPLDSAGTLQLLGLVLVAAATAVTLDVMYGYAGILTFAHALYFGLGCYSVVIFGNTAGIGWPLAVGMGVALTFVVSVVLNMIALRATTPIAFEMVTLAFTAIFAIGIERGFLGSGGEVGVTYTAGVLPASFVGIANTRNGFWLALALAVVIYLFSRYVVRTQVGHVWQAIRENELRVRSLGYDVTRYKLGAAVFSSTSAGVCGVAYSVVMGGADPSIAGLPHSLALILMVVLGGRGRLCGAVLGAAFYTCFDLRLTALSSAGAITDLPAVLRVPLSQPGFLFGVLFVLVILFLPGGLASLGSVLYRSWKRESPRSGSDGPAGDAAGQRTADRVGAR